MKTLLLVALFILGMFLYKNQGLWNPAVRAPIQEYLQQNPLLKP